MTDAVLTPAPDTPEVGRPGRVPDGGHDVRVEPYVRMFAERDWDADPAWLLARRRAAIVRFAALGFPTTKNEDWHFTNVAPIAERVFTPVDVTTPLDAPALREFVFPGEWQQLVFVNGRFAPELSHVELGPGALYAGPLCRALRDEARRQLVERHLGAQVSDTSAFSALNTAFLQDGALVALRGGVVMTTPLHVLHVTTDAAAGALISPRTLLVLGTNAEATVVESFVSLDPGPALTNAVSEVVLEDGARLRHYQIQRAARDAFHVSASYARQGRDSHYETFSFATGAELSRTDVETSLAGPGAHATVNGLYMVDGHQTVDHQTRIEHVAERCTSHEVYKGVLDGAAHAVFNGKVYVHPEAQKTDGKQSNNNLLLSDRARVDTKPQLEIFADDVKCTHGATVGRLDATALFYLKSRGVGEATARKLLTYAFAADVLEQLTVDPVRERLEALAFARFAEG